MRITLIECRVAGTHYNCDEELIRAIAEEAENNYLGLDLVCEPENPHDSKAVAVCYNDVTIGYVPKTLSELVTTVMLQSVKVCCTVTSVNVNESKVFVTLYIDTEIKVSSKG